MKAPQVGSRLTSSPSMMILADLFLTPSQTALN
jgi:hypothetical protein